MLHISRVWREEVIRRIESAPEGSEAEQSVSLPFLGES